MLVPAWPEVLRAGLPVVVQRDAFGVGSFSAIYCDTDDDDVFVYSSDERGFSKLWDADTLLADLRDGDVRDACVRALWRKLRPGEPEPLTAPLFYYDDDTECWWLQVFGQHATFHPRSASCCDGKTCGHHVPALGVLGMPLPKDAPDVLMERDLLALAAVLAHAFGGGA